MPIERLRDFCKETWNNLSQSEKENYCNYTGIIGFVEDCISMLEINPDDITITDLDYIVDKLMTCIDYEAIF